MAHDVWGIAARELEARFGGQTLNHCALLNGSQFAVTPGALRACCAATHEAGTPVICDHGSPRLDPNSFFTGLADLIEANQHSDGPCVGCRHLVKTDVPVRFAAKYLTSVSLHDFCGCNADCIYCEGSEFQLPVKFTATIDHTALFRSLLAERFVRPLATTVFWGGGEPTIVKTFSETSDFLSHARIRQTINTSGVKYSDATERALRARTASACVSVDSGTNETYKRVKGNPNADAVWESIRRYTATGGDVMVKYIILSLNSDPAEVQSFVRRSAQAGVRRIRISVDARSVFGGHPEAPQLTDAEFQAAAHMRNLANAAGMQVVFEDSIWTSNHLDRIGELGAFDAHVQPGPLDRVRQVASPADAREVLELGVAKIRRRLSAR